MALPPLTSSDVGASARSKINDAIAAAGQVATLVEDTKGLRRDQSATATTLRDLSERLSLDILSLNANKASKSALDTFIAEMLQRRTDFTEPPGRPGDMGLSFALVSGLASAGGPSSALPAVPASMLSFGDNGSVLRMVGTGTVASRRSYAVEAGRVYRARFAVQRRSNTSDPSNDTVRLALAWLDQGRGPLPGPDGFTVVADLTTLVTADGRQEISTVFARAAGPDVLITAPKRARYVRPCVQTFGVDGVVDIEVVEVEDITSATVLDPISSDIAARVTALESDDAADRLEKVEQQLQTPNSLTFPTKSSAAAATIPQSVTTVDLRGETIYGDGAGRMHRRIAGALPAGVPGFTSQDGASWARVMRFLGRDDLRQDLLDYFDARFTRSPATKGGAGDGVTDDTAAIQAMIDTYGTMDLGEQSWFCAGPIITSRSHVSIFGSSGGAARLIFGPNAYLQHNGAITVFDSPRMSLRNFAVIARGSRRRSLVRQFLTNEVREHTSRTFDAENVEWISEANETYFDYGVELRNSSLPRLAGCRVRGDRDAYPLETKGMVSFTGDQSPAVLVVEGCHATFCQTMVDVSGSVEGVYMIGGNESVSTDYSIRWNASDQSGAKPLLYYYGNHANCFKGWLATANVVQIVVAMNTFYFQGAAPDGSAFFGLSHQADGENNFLDSFIAFNTFLGFADRQKIAIAINGGTITESLFIDFNNFSSWSTAIVLAVGTEGVVVGEHNRYGNAGSPPVLDQSGFNTICGLVGDVFGKRTFPDGSSEVWGFTDVKVNVAGGASIPWPFPFKQAVYNVQASNGGSTAQTQGAVNANLAASDKNQLAISVSPNPGPDVFVRVNYRGIGR